MACSSRESHGSQTFSTARGELMAQRSEGIRLQGITGNIGVPIHEPINDVRKRTKPTHRTYEETRTQSAQNNARSSASHCQVGAQATSNEQISGPGKPTYTHEQYNKAQRSVAQTAAAPIPKRHNDFRRLEEPEVVDLDAFELDDRASVAPSVAPSEVDAPGRNHRSRSRGAGRPASATYDCLPERVSRDEFKKVYMPTVVKYIVKTSDPWSNCTSEFLRIIQSVWDQLFPHSPQSFSTSSNEQCKLILRLISQRVYEWRGKFATAAIDAVLEMEAKDPIFQDPDYRHSWVAWARRDDLQWPFLYADTESENPKEWTGTFQSPLIMRTFSIHLSYIASAVVIKQLRDIEDKQPTSGLALAIAAVERALSVWDTGDLQDWHRLRDKDRPAIPKFDASTWGPNTQSWYTSISALDPEDWIDIINDASEYVKPISRKKPASRSVSNMDSRALLVPRSRRKAQEDF